jgi:hypothetical protein
LSGLPETKETKIAENSDYNIDPQEANGEAEEEKRASFTEFPLGERKEKKTRRHRSSIMEGMTEEAFKSFTTNEMERGLVTIFFF